MLVIVPDPARDEEVGRVYIVVGDLAWLVVFACDRRPVIGVVDGRALSHGIAPVLLLEVCYMHLLDAKRQLRAARSRVQCLQPATCQAKRGECRKRRGEGASAGKVPFAG